MGVKPDLDGLREKMLEALKLLEQVAKPKPKPSFKVLESSDTSPPFVKSAGVFYPPPRISFGLYELDRPNAKRHEERTPSR